MKHFHFNNTKTVKYTHEIGLEYYVCGLCQQSLIILENTPTSSLSSNQRTVSQRNKAQSRVSRTLVSQTLSVTHPQSM